jgi:hypothetical protein
MEREMSNHRTLTINLAGIILAAGVALPASFGTSLAAEQSSPSLAAEQPSPEDITLKTPRTPRGLSLIVYSSKLVVDAVELARQHRNSSH